MTDKPELRDRVLEALKSDESVLGVFAFQHESETFILGCRDTYGEPWGALMFVIVLEEQQGKMSKSGHELLQEMKQGLSAHSSIKGTAWYGTASTVETAMIISKGEGQREPPRNS